MDTWTGEIFKSEAKQSLMSVYKIINLLLLSNDIKHKHKDVKYTLFRNI